MVLRGREVMRDWADWRRSPDHYAGTALTSVFVLLTHRLRPEPELAAGRRRPAARHPRAAASRASTTSTPRSPTRRCCAAALGQIGAGVGYARSVADEFADEAVGRAGARGGRGRGRGLRAVR